MKNYDLMWEKIYKNLNLQQDYKKEKATLITTGEIATDIAKELESISNDDKE